MSEGVLDRIRELVQQDVGHRGLATNPADNLLTATREDLAAACHSLASRRGPAAADRLAVAIVTGFFIPHATPPAGETDGPLGALFLARALLSLGAHVVLATDAYCVPALAAGLAACRLDRTIPLLTLPAGPADAEEYWRDFTRLAGGLTHLVAIERVGPSHTVASVSLASLRCQEPAVTEATVQRFAEEVPAVSWGRCHTMRGLDITPYTSPAHLLFEEAGRQSPAVVTIGIGDGGNEIGMGKVPWDVIRRNIPRGNLVACRVATDHLIASGISNWGAYALAAGVYALRRLRPPTGLFDADHEEALLRRMVEAGPLVDGVAGRPAVSVDGLPFERYAEPLRQLAAILNGERGA